MTTKSLIFAIMHIFRQMYNSNLFFLTKGTPTYDSRSPIGLAHQLKVDQRVFTAKLGTDLKIPIEVQNTGEAKWLVQNVKDIGIVKLGFHLYQKDKLLDFDFARSAFSHDVKPGQRRTAVLTVKFDEPGTYTIAVDLVAEQIAWFENLGSKPVQITINVAE